MKQEVPMRTYFFTYEELEYLASMLIAQGEIVDQKEIPWFRFQKRRERKRTLTEFRNILARIIPVINEADQTNHKDTLQLELDGGNISLLQRVIHKTLAFTRMSNEGWTEETEKLLYIGRLLQKKFEIVKSGD